MECLEFRRLLGSDPHASGADAREHLRNCPACAEAQARALAFESVLVRALAVPVPEGLAGRVLLTRLSGARQRERTRRHRTVWAALAVAAGLTLAIGIARYPRESVPPLSGLVIAHIDGGEREALKLRKPVAAAAVERAFADRGVTLQSVPAGISYVHECPVGPYRSVHMVMPENDTPVSVLYVVDHRTRNAGDFTGGALHGREIPIASGTLVLAAQATDHFDAIEHLWRDAIEGPAQVAAGSR